MQATRSCVGAASELSTSMQFGHNYFDTREFGSLFNVHRDPTTVVVYFD